MLPPLHALRAFEAAARLLSVSRAAEELRVTQPAVSQHLKLLERHLGVRLLERRGTRIGLTPEGAEYAQALTRGFGELDEATRRIAARRQGGVVTVSLLPTLAVRWLIPRLRSFQEAAPEIEVRLSTTARLVDLGREDVDLAIRYGQGRWSGCEAEPLLPDDMFPVASPALASRLPLAAVADLRRHTLLRVAQTPRDADWPAWLAAAGAPGLAGAHQLGFDSSAQALEAALAGLGVAMAHRPFVADDLAAGRLLAPFALTVPSSGAYFIVSHARARARPAVSRFRDWLLGQAAAGRRQP